MTSLATDWGELAYTDRGGSGAALILLHGTGCDSSDWNCTIAALPPAVRVVTMDFRSHGHSGAPRHVFSFDDLAGDVLQLMAHLGIEAPVLAGHSLGGMVAIAAAARSPSVRGLVLLEGWTCPAAAEAFEEPRTFGALSRYDIEAIAQKSVRTRRRVAPQVWEHFVATVQAFNGYPFLEKATIPVIEVYGAAGRTEVTQAGLHVPPNPRIEWTWIEGAGHYLPHEAPDEVAQACNRGFQRATPLLSTARVSK